MFCIYLYHNNVLNHEDAHKVVAGMIVAYFADWILATHPEVEIVGIDNLSTSNILSTAW